MTHVQPTADDLLGGYTCRRWRRYGHDRLYVTVADSTYQLGYRDLVVGDDHPESAGAAEQLKAVADAWLARHDVLAKAEPTTPAAAPWHDLSLNQPGEAAQTQASAKRAEAPVRTTIARVLGVHTEERAWRVGATGERRVADELAKLSRKDNRWTAIHAIPVGSRGSDIDHLVIGPGGVFTLNTKHHPDGKVWVGGDTVMVNGSRTAYVRNARHEAERASRILSSTTGRSVPVGGLLVLVGCASPITVKTQPRGVSVVARRDLVTWLTRLGDSWTSEELGEIWEAARRSTTWR